MHLFCVHNKMGLNLFVRRACSSLISGDVISLRSRHLITCRFQRFSTATGGGIESSKQSSDVQGMFSPFKINKEKAEYRDLFLVLDKKLEDETISVEVQPVYGQDGQNEILRCLKVLVEVVREDKCLYFQLYARPGQMIIPEMYMSGDLEAFKKILEIRAVNRSTTKFLFDYMRERNKLNAKEISVQLLPGPTSVNDGSPTETLANVAENCINSESSST